VNKHLTPEELRVKLAKEAVKPEDMEEEYAKSIFVLEKELGCHIDDNYPLMKFYSQLECLDWYRKEEKKAYDKANKKNKLMK